MKISTLFLPIILSSSQTIFSHEIPPGLDYRASGQAAYPWSANVDAWLGYGFLIYGKSSKPVRGLDDIFFGYLRPNLRFQSFGLINRLEGRLDIYPISFIGFTMGQVFVHRNLSMFKNTKNKSGVDCETLACNGLLMRSFIETKIKGAYEKFFAVFLWRRDFLYSSASKNRGFLDSNAPLIGEGRSDILQTEWLKLGHKLNDEWVVGLHVEHASMRDTSQDAYQEKIFAAYSINEEWTLGGGFKLLQSPLYTVGWGIGLQIDWNGKASLEL